MNKLIFTPIEASNATEKYVDEIQANDGDGMPLYIRKMEYSAKDRKGFMPVKRGEIITVLGRPGNGKTGLKLRWARERAKDLAKKPNNKGVVLYLTMEQMVEELRLFHVAAENNISASDMASGQITDWGSVKTSLRRLHTTPLWFAGKSNARRKDRVKITVDTLAESLAAIEKWTGDELDQSVDSVFIDYLQRFRSDGRDWVQFYGDTVNALKDLAGDFSTRIILGVQARREVDQRDVPIPQMDDGQWTSGIEQQSDGMISVCRPSHYKVKGESFDGVTVEGHEQMIVSVLKRKMGPENFKEWVKFSPEYNRLDELEVKNYDFRKGHGSDE
jgi:replicative DNA helicase